MPAERQALAWQADCPRELGDEVHFTTIAELLHGPGYSLQANAKVKEASSTPTATPSFATSMTAADRRVVKFGLATAAVHSATLNIGRGERDRGGRDVAL